jgi:hypothetical protein
MIIEKMKDFTIDEWQQLGTTSNTPHSLISLLQKLCALLSIKSVANTKD